MIVQEKIDRLIGVLYMSKKEQWKWLANEFPDELHCCLCVPPCHIGRHELADLAFRLRDEVKDLPSLVWSKAWHLVVAKVKYNYDWNNEALEENFKEFCETYHGVPDSSDREIFALWNSQPIHWIIAALIAKQLKESK